MPIDRFANQLPTYEQTGAVSISCAELSALKADNARLREALTQIKDCPRPSMPGWRKDQNADGGRAAVKMGEIAAAALKDSGHGGVS